MTRIGNAIASSTTSEQTDGYRVLSFLRKNKWKCSDSQLQNFVIQDKYQLNKTLEDLKRAQAIVEIGRS